MLIDMYFEQLHSHINAVAAQQEQILQAARLCADALVNGRALHVFDSGHLVSKELIHRAGGLVAMNALSLDQVAANTIKVRRDIPLTANTLDFAKIESIFETEMLQAGDVLFIGSVSGKTASVVELAQQARAHRIAVIALTALAYSSRLDSEHPSGKRLFESADLVLDNTAPYGDAMLEIPGLDFPICPASGICAAALMWAVVAGIVAEMLSRGLKPTVYPSVNRPDGRNLVSQVEALARAKGY
jgi:uncharacterized phosphosugar-binding protein